MMSTTEPGKAPCVVWIMHSNPCVSTDTGGVFEVLFGGYRVRPDTRVGAHDTSEPN